MPIVELAGGSKIAVATALEDVVCTPASSYEPSELSIEALGRIASLAGAFNLAQLRGRISSSDRRRGWLSRARNSNEPAQLVRVTAPQGGQDAATGSAAYPDLEGGQLIGVDVTRVSYADIQALSHLHVFDPHGRTLTSHAKDRDPPTGKHERAQRLKLLADAVSTRAASGNTRSAVMWASARAHHAVVTNLLESAARWAHWALGYGHRPLPALLTYLAWLVGMSTVLTLVDAEPTCAPPAADTNSFTESPYSFWQQVARVLLLPAGLLRLELGGATTYAPIGCSAGWHTVVFAVTGVLLVYLVLALRNFLRTPGGKAHP
jgi:hypothetical protein